MIDLERLFFKTYYKMAELNKNQLMTWQQAYEWGNLPKPKYICFGRFPLTKEGKEFFKPFLQAGYIHADTLKFTGVFRLTEKGKQNFKTRRDNKKFLVSK